MRVNDRGSGRNSVLRDPGYDATAIRRRLRARHIVPRRRLIALHCARELDWAGGVGSWSGRLPGSISFAVGACRMRRTDTHEAFLSLGCGT